MFDKMQFEQFLKPEHIKFSRIIHVSMIFASTMFLAVLFFLGYQSSNASSTTGGDGSFMQILFLVWLVVFLTTGLAGWLFHIHPLGKIIIRGQLKPWQNTGRKPSNEDLIRIFYSLSIVRWAFMESAILFGVVVVFLSLTNGNFSGNVYPQIVGLGSLILIIILGGQHPTTARVVNEVEKIAKVIEQ